MKTSLSSELRLMAANGETVRLAGLALDLFPDFVDKVEEAEQYLRYDLGEYDFQAEERLETGALVRRLEVALEGGQDDD